MLCMWNDLFNSRRNRLVTSGRDNKRSKYSSEVAVAGDWTTSPSYNSLVLSHHHRHHHTAPSYLTLQYQPQRRRRKLSEPDFPGTRTALIDLRRAIPASQSQTGTGQSHGDVTGVRYCSMTSYGNTDLDWPTEVWLVHIKYHRNKSRFCSANLRLRIAKFSNCTRKTQVQQHAVSLSVRYVSTGSASFTE